MPAAVAAAIEFVAAAIGTEMVLTAGQIYLASQAIVATAAVYTLRENQRRQQNAARDSYNASLRDRYVMTRGATEPRQVVLGRQRVSGPLAYIGSYGANREHLVFALILAAHEIDAIEHIYFDDERVTLDGSGNVLAVNRRDLFTLTGASGTFTLSSEPAAGTVSATVAYGTTQVSLGVSVSGSSVTVSGGTAGATGTVTIAYQPAQSPWTRTEEYTDDQAVVSLDGLGNGSLTLPQVPQAGTVRVVYSTGSGEGQSDYDLTPYASVSSSVLTVTGSPVTGVSAYVSYRWNASSSKARVRKYLGAPGQTADAGMIAALPGVWTSAHTLTGLAYLVVELDYDPDAFPSGLPNVSAQVRGAKLYDPRTGTTTWSQNPALMMRYVATSSLLGRQSSATVNDASVIVAANVCDTTSSYVVNGRTYSRALYTAGLAVKAGTWAKDILDDLARAMAGRWVFIDGQLRIKAGAWTTPLQTLDESWLVGNQAVQVQARSNRSDVFNVATGKFADETRDYQVADYPRVAAASYITEDGAELPLDLQLNAVTFTGQAQQVAAVSMRDARQGLRVSLLCNMRAFPVEVFDTLYVTLPRFGWSSKAFEVLDVSWTLDGGIQLSLKETDPSIWALGTSFADTDPAPNTLFPSPWRVPPITGLTCASGTTQLLKQSDGTILSRIEVNWNALTDAFVLDGGGVEVRYGFAWQTEDEWQSVEAPGGQSVVFLTESIRDGLIYLVKARAFNALVKGAWSTPVLHEVVGKSSPPANVGSFGYIVTEAGVEFSWTPATDADYASTVLKSGAVWASATRLFDGAANKWTWVRPASGTYTVLAKHKDTSGNESAAAASITFTYTSAGISNADVSLTPAGTLVGGGGGSISLGSIAGSIIAAQLPAIVDATKFASGVEPVTVVTGSTVPTTKSTNTIYLTGTGKLYRWSGTAYTAAVPTTDLSGTVVSSQIADGAVIATKIADAALTTAKFGSGIEPLTIVTGALPTTKSTSTIFRTDDSKTYRWNGTAYVATVPTSDLTGTVTDAQIAGLAASKVTGQLSDSQIAAVGAAKLTGQVVSSQIADASISTAKFASGIEPITVVASVPGTKSTNSIFNTADGKLYRWSGSAYVATVPAGDISGTLAAAQIASVAASQITGQLSDTQLAAIGAAKVTGQVVGTQITDGAISTAKLAAGSVTAAVIAADSITAAQIAANAITSSELAAGAVVAGKIAAGSIQAADIAAGTITGDRLAANTITASQIASNTITAGQIAAGAIGASQIAAGAITTDKLLVTGGGAALNDDPGFSDASAWGLYSGVLPVFGTVTDGVVGSRVARSSGAGVQAWINVAGSRRIPVDPNKAYRLRAWARTASGSGSTLYIGLALFDAAGANITGDGSQWSYAAAGGVTVPTSWTKYLAAYGTGTGITFPANARTMSPLAILSYGGGTCVHEVQDLRIEEMASADLIVDGAISAGKIAAGAVTTAKLDAGSITADKMAANAISAGAIQAGAITTAKIAAGAVTANEIAAATITGGQIAAGTITASNIATDTITAGQIAAGAVGASEVAAGAITTAKLAAGAVTANEVAAGAITTAKLAAGAVTANELSANSVVAGKIATGAVNAAQIAAGAITTDKLLVTGRGAALNEDPGCQDPTGWQNGGHGDTASRVAISDGIAGSYAFRSTTGTASSIDTAKLYPVSSGKRYRLSVWVRRSSTANGVLYLRLVDQAGNQLTQFYEGATPTTNWVRLAAEYVPTTAQTSVRIRLILNWTGTAGYHEATDIRLEEKAEGDLIVDGTIAASKIAAGTLTADKMVSGLLSSDNVLTRGLTVRDNSGNVLFGVGTNLDWGRISNQPSGIYNSNISISGGAIQGIGTGAGTTVANSLISIGTNGALSGAGGGQVTIGGLGYSGDLNATFGAVAGANLRDSNGRTVSDVRLLGNLLDSTAWVPDSTGSQTGFPENGTSSGGLNYIAYDSLPDGSRGVLWRARSGSAAGSSSEGGWNSTSFNVNASRMYRFSVWIRCFGANASGSFYLGVGGGTVSDIGGSVNYNPYFQANGRSLLPDSQWVLVVGYVYPSSYGGTQYNRGGVYRGSDGVKILDGTDFKWVAGTTSAYHRTYQYYTNQANNYQDFWNPRVDLVDGTEPSLDSLLAGGKAYAASLTATWSGVASRPSNLAGLSGSEAIQNAQITISGGAIQGIGSGAGTAVANANISIGSNGALSGAGGGQVTLGGIGFSGDTDAQRNSRITVDGSGLLQGIGSGAGTPVSNSVLPSGVNLQYNSDFTNGLDGWTAAGGYGISGQTEGGVNLSTAWYLAPYNGPGTGVLWSRQGARVGSDGYYYEIEGRPCAVVGGKRYAISAYTGAHRCKVAVFAYVYDASNSAIANTYVGNVENNEEASGGSTLTGYKRTVGVATLPSNAAYVKVRLRKYDTKSGYGDSYMFVGRVQVEQVADSASDAGPWNPMGYVADDSVGIAKFGTDIQTTNYSTGASGQGWRITKAGAAYFNQVSVRGEINGGSYTGYAWPGSGTWGFHLGPNGLLLGNANNGRYFQVTYDGQIYAPGFQIVNGSATFSGTLSGAIVNTDQIVGNAASTPYATTSTGASVSLTVAVPSNASGLLIQYYLGPDTYTYTGGGGKGDPGGYVQGPVLTGLTYDGTTTSVVVVSPTAGNHTITVTRSYYTGTMRLSVLVLKR